MASRIANIPTRLRSYCNAFSGEVKCHWFTAIFDCCKHIIVFIGHQLTALMEFCYQGIQQICNLCKQLSSYALITAQYPVFRIAKRILHFAPCSVEHNLDFSGKHPATLQLMRKEYSYHILIVQLSELEQCRLSEPVQGSTPQHQIWHIT